MAGRVKETGRGEAMGGKLLISYAQKKEEKPKPKPIEVEEVRHPKNRTQKYQVWVGHHTKGQWWWHHIISVKDVNHAFYIVKTMLSTTFCFLEPTPERIFEQYGNYLILSPDNTPVDMPKLSTIQPDLPFPPEEEKRGKVTWEMLDKIGELCGEIEVSYEGRI